MKKVTNNIIGLVVATFGVACASLSSYSVNYFTKASGNWGSATTWGTACGSGTGAVPGAGDNVTICAGYNVTVAADAAATNVTIQNGGYLKIGGSGGGANKQLNISGTFAINDGGTCEYNTNDPAATTIFAGIEVFGNASTFIVTEWSATTTNLITGLGSNFGNLTLNYNTGAFLWQCPGLGITRKINGNLSIGTNGVACLVFCNNTAGNIIMTIGGNLDMQAGTLLIKYNASGNVDMTVTGNTTISGSATFYGVYFDNGNCTFITSNFTMTGGTFFLTRNGDGIATFTASGTFSQSGGDCRGSYYTSTYTAGYGTYNFNTFNFTGGIFLAIYGCHTGGIATTFNVTNNCTINFGSSGDIFRIIGFGKLNATYNNSPINFTVGGNLVISGAAGEFSSSPGSGNETNTFTNVTISGGANTFNTTIDAGNAHNTTTNINGNLTVSGGAINFSQNTGTLTCNITGNISISSGTVNTSTDATSNLNLTVGTASITWAQTGGTVSLCNTNIKTGKTVTMTGNKMGDVQASRTIVVESGATLWCSDYPVAGSGNFTLSSGSKIGSGSAAGLTASGATGNVQVSGTRIYNSNATYEYYEGQTPQSTGNFTTTTTSGTYPAQVTYLIINKTNTTDIVNLTNTTDIINSGILTLTKGILTTSSTAATAPWIRIPSGSSVSPAGGSAGSFVNGFIRKQGSTAFVFPTGDGTRWQRISIGAPSAVSEYEARFINAPYSNLTPLTAPILEVSPKRHWILNRIGGGNCTVSLYWNDASEEVIDDCTPPTSGDLLVARWNGSSWVSENTTGGSLTLISGPCAPNSSGYITSQTVTSFSPFTFGSKTAGPVNPLPVILLSFTAECNRATQQPDNSIILKWETATEQNNNYFTIERSADGLQWKEIGTVKGANNSSSIQHYEFSDLLPNGEGWGGALYYRLKQTDYDGKSETFSPIAVSCTDNNNFSVAVNPNPNDGDFQLSVTGAGKQKVLVVMRDVFGREVYSKTDLEQSNGIFFINLKSQLPAGVYTIIVSSNDEVVTRKVVVR